ncbi:MAG: EAL domain-containing protein [Sphingomonadales bacterium]|nr:EAL domain-containing protein [Sphingomonadales bacterium]
MTLNKRKIAGVISLIAAITAIIGGIELLQPISLSIEILQKKIKLKEASGQVVIVGIDSPSIKEVGRWPWPRSKQAELLQRIDQQKPQAIYVDIGYQGKTEPREDDALRRTLAGMQSKTKIIALASDNDTTTPETVYSHQQVVGKAPAVSAYLPYLFSYIWEIPLNIETSRGRIQSLSASAANIKTDQVTTYKLDYSINPKTIPIVNAVDVLKQTAGAKKLAGKTVIVGVTDLSQNDVHSMPGWGEYPGVVFHALGTETLKRNIPISIGWGPLFIFSLLVGMTLLTTTGLRQSKFITIGGIAILLVASSWLTVIHIPNDPLPGITFLIASGIYVGLKKAALLRVQRTIETGFNNSASYTANEILSTGILIAAKFTIAENKARFEEPITHTKIIREVGHRLTSLVDEKQLTHNETGQFLWEIPSMKTEEFVNYVTALRNLFIKSIDVDNHKLEVDIYFGIDRDVMESVKQRSANAIAASTKAHKTGSTYIVSNPRDYLAEIREQFEQEFSRAIKNGQVLVMLNATKNLQTGQMNSAEANAHWNHPIQGNITASQIQIMAQNTNNVPMLYDYLTIEAIQHAAKLSSINSSFTISLKIPTMLLLEKEFITKLIDMLKAESCEPSALTIEIIDFREYLKNESVINKIKTLKNTGVKIGLGDFGTSSDDIHILQNIRFDEIFFSREFTNINRSIGQKILVDAALRIAKLYSIITTADDLEDSDILTELRHMGCNQARGKIIDIPLKIDDFIKSNITIIADKTY